VSEAGFDPLDRYAVLDQGGGVVAAQRVRVREPVGHSGVLGVAAEDLRERLLRYRPARAVAREPNEDRLLVREPATAALRVHAQPRVEHSLSVRGNGDLALDVALTPDEQVMMDAV